MFSRKGQSISDNDDIRALICIKAPLTDGQHLACLWQVIMRTLQEDGDNVNGLISRVSSPTFLDWS
jgi:hypothetical protein